MTEPIVADPAEAKQLENGAALVLGPIREFLDAAGLGAGELSAAMVGDGHSNLSFLLRRGEERFVLRRPPRGELAPSANDVLREARVLTALAATPVPVPTVLAVCEDASLIGAPFFVMSFVEGVALGDGLPSGFDSPDVPEAITSALVCALADLHDADLDTTGLAAFGKQDGYLERQLRRFASLLEHNATRPLPDLEAIAEWLQSHRPTTPVATFVHGDYRLGNLMFAAPGHLAAVLDWEMATVGDPLADLGYCTAVWAEPGEEENPMLALSRVTRLPGFRGREWIAERYTTITGRSIDALSWYQVLALWKAAIFLEGSYRRYLTGHSADAYFAQLGEGVPALGRAALSHIRQVESS